MIEIERNRIPGFDETWWAALVESATSDTAHIGNSGKNIVSHSLEREGLIVFKYSPPAFPPIIYPETPDLRSKWLLNRDGALLVRVTPLATCLLSFSLFLGVAVLVAGSLLSGLALIVFTTCLLLDRLAMTEETEAFLEYIELYRA